MENYGEITGVVTSQNGDTLPGVTITVENNTSGEKQVAITRANGSYIINYLEAGQYSLIATLVGCNPFIYNDIIVRINNPTRVDIIM